MNKPDDDVYQAERIIDHKVQRGKRFFLIKWHGWDVSNNTWEPERNILDKLLIDNYFKRCARVKSKQRGQTAEGDEYHFSSSNTDDNSSSSDTDKGSTDEESISGLSNKDNNKLNNKVKTDVPSTAVSSELNEQEILAAFNLNDENDDNVSIANSSNKLVINENDQDSTASSILLAENVENKLVLENKDSELRDVKRIAEGLRPIVKTPTPTTNTPTTLTNLPNKKISNKNSKPTSSNFNPRIRRRISSSSSTTHTNSNSNTTSSASTPLRHKLVMFRRNIKKAGRGRHGRIIKRKKKAKAQLKETDNEENDQDDHFPDENHLHTTDKLLEPKNKLSKSKKDQNHDDSISKYIESIDMNQHHRNTQDVDEESDNSESTLSDETDHTFLSILADNVFITDVTSGIVTVTIKECVSPEGFFKKRLLNLK